MSDVTQIVAPALQKNAKLTVAWASYHEVGSL